MTLKFMLKFKSITKRGLGAYHHIRILRNFNTIQRPKFFNDAVSVSCCSAIQKNCINIKGGVCEIHVSSSNNALPPILLIILRPLAKIFAILFGRSIRKWWSKLSPEEKEKIMNKVASKKSQLAAIGTAFILLIYWYYLENLVEDPITKRKKFVILNHEQLFQIAEYEYKQHIDLFHSDIVPQYHPLHRRVARVVDTILSSNINLVEIRNKVWSVTVVDRPEITNAFALPHGKIFVFTGMLNLCSNDDQLAIILAHEISHSILTHIAETMSKVYFFEFIFLIPSIIFWSVFSDAWALFSEWITSTLAKILIHLPFSRFIEREADLVGLQLAAKSCYDVREAPILWAKMKIVSQDNIVEWLSTHPRHESRQMELQALVPQALLIRESNRCPPLSSRKPYM